jgi:hypothetical protein
MVFAVSLGHSTYAFQKGCATQAHASIADSNGVGSEKLEDVLRLGTTVSLSEHNQCEFHCMRIQLAYVCYAQIDKTRIFCILGVSVEGIDAAFKEQGTVDLDLATQEHRVHPAQVPVLA